MLRTVLAATAMAAGLLLYAGSPAQAQALCGERDNFLTHLGKNHKEAPTAMGVTSSGRVIEVLTSENGSWTIIVTHPNGTSCMLAAGEAWEAVERIAMGPTT
ncbi:MAG: hypothetical protein QF491_23275 [Alphaproteobacteria bacterium]|nr:hypothetical protein [Alphaproteobacteria bacterium]